ncbi:hypothetical protein B0T24DRAFT_687351 [Lasiosphaeria ovina]|uniref:G domain-containing protein n=1 Tax=Lasiosphaeria ovina TaxID=92902 RepID=A0AAE0TXF0_9PEZI|nr:hypothetical protein B0T24DRAFT_687351 [Lasiosphaeria ovina]
MEPQDEFSELADSVVIAFMGVTGSGKSSFVSLLADQHVEVSHGLHSHTLHAQAYSFFDEVSQRTVFLVDMPGFDDTVRSDAEILKEVSYFLAALHGKNVRLAGLVYLHRISDARVPGSAVKDLRMFKALVGAHNYRRVVLATTMWSALGGAGAGTVGAERQAELETTFWADMVQAGSQVRQHSGSRGSALDIIRSLLVAIDMDLGQEQEAAAPLVTLAIQHELMVEGRMLGETAAGRVLFDEIATERSRAARELDELQSGLAVAERAGDERAREAIQAEREAITAWTTRRARDGDGLGVSIFQLAEEQQPRYREAAAAIREGNSRGWGRGGHQHQPGPSSSSPSSPEPERSRTKGPPKNNKRTTRRERREPPPIPPRTSSRKLKESARHRLRCLGLDAGALEPPLLVKGADDELGELDGKRVQTVFDVVSRLAEDGTAAEGRGKNVDAAVLSLPEACKSLGSRTSGFGVGSILPSVEKSFVSDATRVADQLIAANAASSRPRDDCGAALLRSIRAATPKPLGSIAQLLKRLQSALAANTGQPHPANNSPGGLAINWQSLLDGIEPHLYGYTPICQALRTIQPIFRSQTYGSKVMMLISDGDSTDGDPLPLARVLGGAAGAMIFTCLLTDSAIQVQRRLRAPHEADPRWPSAARAMFDMTSAVPYDSGPVQALRRRGWELPESGLCKLFIHANNPLIIDEFTTVSRQLAGGGSSDDSLADMIGQANEGAQVTDQDGEPICWAHATADLTAGEKKAWTDHQNTAVGGLLGDLPQSFRALPVACPHCRDTAPASDYGGVWYEARCGSCARTFKPTVRALVRSLYGSGNYGA